MSSEASAWLLPALRRMGLVAGDEAPRVEALAGGVSSDIYRVDLRGGPVCVKRALPRLKVSAVWNAPVERNRWEVAWMRAVAAIEPAFVPRVLADDAQSGSFAMEYLAPGRHPVWKAQLRDGAIDPAFAAEVGARIAKVHAATAGDAAVARAFATDHVFFPIRLEPYLAATAERHADCRAALLALVEATAANKRALVHGDVSPKNILAGPAGPVLLDAECAWYGDPAFDLAFCLNHMLLKGIWRPHWRARYLECFDALAGAYLRRVTWEPAEQLERRAAHLLPGLLLGRIDGKSPVEYITGERDRDFVRAHARARLLHPAERLAQVRW